jgi:hypothetical protein
MPRDAAWIVIRLVATQPLKSGQAEILVRLATD